MATTSEEWLKKFKAAEKDLYKSLAQKDPTFAEIDTLLTRIRNAFENLPISIPYDAETRLWDAHSKINGRYRKQLSKFHGEEGKRRPVEKRKLEKHYVDFIKSSMRFYRGHIQRLASQHPAIKDLAQVAGKLNMDTTTIDEVSVPTEEVKKATLQSCHATLIRLGDLSRYRETELKSRERNWGPATGYYELALSINKESGLPHNQMAVIALADGNHLRALYRLYRAQAVKSPHPSARNNLDIEFSKIIHLKEKNELFSQGGIRGGVSAERTVEAWFLYFHARCDKGAQWAEYEDAENELLSQLSVLLKDRPVEGQLERSTSLLQRVTLINIAAEYVARQRAAEQKDNEGFLAAYRFYEQLNLKTFSNLLHIMTGELAEKGELTSVLRRILPALRNYSGWLLTNVSFLVAQHDDPFLGMHIKFFWTTYAKALTSLAATFPVENLPAPISYMLSEDEDTIGFVPLYNDDTSRRYYGVDDELKPCHRKEHIPTEAPHLEMLFRESTEHVATSTQSTA
ncbi:putative smg protein [Phaeomoniella chlamydospora]|uniref:Putative smg protein n=1 Tax=Phaeomoniella chlamydospora TaxID=158046 RepID=A0A0G2EAT4_PHACM|nr:putative smg protein [Phaeomoniella chlamydospora]